jgi:hypothetical protein
MTAIAERIRGGDWNPWSRAELCANVTLPFVRRTMQRDYDATLLRAAGRRAGISKEFYLRIWRHSLHKATRMQPMDFSITGASGI